MTKLLKEDDTILDLMNYTSRVNKEDWKRITTLVYHSNLDAKSTIKEMLDHCMRTDRITEQWMLHKYLEQ